MSVQLNTGAVSLAVGVAAPISLVDRTATQTISDTSRTTAGSSTLFTAGANGARVVGLTLSMGAQISAAVNFEAKLLVNGNVVAHLVYAGSVTASGCSEAISMVFPYDIAPVLANGQTVVLTTVGNIFAAASVTTC